MPAIAVKRMDPGRNQGRTLTPTAVGFLVPLLLVFLCAPFACVFFIRRRRSGQPPDYILNLRTPAQRKNEAKEKLASVTEVSSVITGDAKEFTDENASVLERECAICLSALYAPSPPEPIKVAGGPTPSKSPSVSGLSLNGEKEEILRLNACGHEYHMECLLSWFMVRKYSCPICRAVYYETKKPEEPTATEEGQGDAQNEGTPHTQGNENGNGSNTITSTNNQTNSEPRREQV